MSVAPCQRHYHIIYKRFAVLGPNANTRHYPDAFNLLNGQRAVEPVHHLAADFAAGCVESVIVCFYQVKLVQADNECAYAIDIERILLQSRAKMVTEHPE